MTDPALYPCCGGRRSWNGGHKLDCPVRVRAMERRKNQHRALRHDQETRRAGVETTPLHVAPAGEDFRHWNRCTIPNCRRCKAFENAADRGYDQLSGA